MKRKEQTIVEKEIPGREHAGYAYIYPLDGGARQEYVLEMTPENIANFIGAHQYDAEKIILTDMLDNLILDTAGGFIMNCPDQILCGLQRLDFALAVQLGQVVALQLADAHGVDAARVDAAQYFVNLPGVGQRHVELLGYQEVLPLLAPIQMGRRRAKEIPVVSRAAFEAYAPQKDKPGAQ